MTVTISMTTSQLLEFGLTSNDYIEAVLHLNTGFITRHFISVDKNSGSIYDTGCDDEEWMATRQEFLAEYPDSLGNIWHIENMDLVIDKH